MYIIQGKKELSGKVSVGGSKNAALPIIAASLLIAGKSILHNVPDISDVHDFIHFLESLGCEVSFKNHILSIDAASVSLKNIDSSKIERTRAGIYFIAGLLARFGEATIPFPSGDKIGKRPIDEHIQGYVGMGYLYKQSRDNLIFSGNGSTDDVTITAYFAVTATANLLMGAVARTGITTIELAAFEPHIFNLVDFLRKAGVEIHIRYDHTIIVHGTKHISQSIDFEIISDYLQSGTFIIIGALSAKTYIDIHRARICDLRAFLYKLHEAGVKTQDLGDDILRVYKAEKLSATNIQTNIFPGFPTDLMPLFTVLMTQSEGTSRVHEILYEGRLNWLVEYERLGCSPRIINLHEAKIEGPCELLGASVNSWDLRSGAAMVIAGLIAEGETRIDNIHWIARGYDDFLGKLQSLGADIQEITSHI